MPLLLGLVQGSNLLILFGDIHCRAEHANQVSLTVMKRHPPTAYGLAPVSVTQDQLITEWLTERHRLQVALMQLQRFLWHQHAAVDNTHAHGLFFRDAMKVQVLAITGQQVALLVTQRHRHGHRIEYPLKLFLFDFTDTG
ncbi:hypothetical protein D3C87_1438770 [compost metagenome]